jgi:methionyl-tRNA formyltransferase
MSGSKHLCYVSCTEGGYEVLRNLLQSDIDIQEIVSLTPEQGSEYNVAGYHSMEPLAEEHNIPVYYPETYKMDTERDITHFQEIQPDVMIVNGWQRLIRDPVLETVSIGAFGVHGSGSGLPKGRGRSPMNWSLLSNLIAELIQGRSSGHINTILLISTPFGRSITSS